MIKVPNRNVKEYMSLVWVSDMYKVEKFFRDSDMANFMLLQFWLYLLFKVVQVHHKDEKLISMMRRMEAMKYSPTPKGRS